MEIGQIEHLLNLFLKMLMEHPELCPHEWEIWQSYPDTQDGKSGRTYEYKCGICCGHKFEFKEREKIMKKLKFPSYEYILLGE